MKKNILIGVSWVILIVGISVWFVLYQKTENKSKQVIELANQAFRTMNASEMKLHKEFKKQALLNPCFAKQLYDASQRLSKLNEELLTALDSCENGQIAIETRLVEAYLDSCVSIHNKELKPVHRSELTKTIEEDSIYQKLKKIGGDDRLLELNCLKAAYFKLLLSRINYIITEKLFNMIPGRQDVHFPALSVAPSRTTIRGAEDFEAKVSFAFNHYNPFARVIVSKGYDSVNNRLINIVDTFPVDNGEATFKIKNANLNLGLNKLHIEYQYPHEMCDTVICTRYHSVVEYRVER